MGCCFCLGTSSGPDEFSKQLISEHNTYRKKHSSQPLKWSPEAAAKAQEWANHLASTGRLEHGNHEGMGQNLAFYSGGTFTSAQAAQMWYDEYKSYNYNRPGFTSGTGHFTQMIWASTKEIGIGFAIKGQSTFVVANYVSPGNVQGRFEQNVMPPV